MIIQTKVKISVKITAIVAVLAALLLCWQMLQPVPAYAYFELPGPYVQFGSGSVNVDVGNSASVSCQINPIQEQQMKGCGVDYCPQKCNASCLVNGWCRCEGETYYTYFTNVQVSSSNTGVAGASWANGMLTVYGNGVGTATITVSTALDKHVGSSASITVNVSQPNYGGGGYPNNGNSGQLGQNTDANTANTANTGSDASIDDSVTVLDRNVRMANGVAVGVAVVDENLNPFDIEGLGDASDFDLLGLSSVTATMVGAGTVQATAVVQRPLLMPTPVPMAATAGVLLIGGVGGGWVLLKRATQRKAALMAARASAKEAIKKG